MRLAYNITSAITYHGGGILPYAINPKTIKYTFYSLKKLMAQAEAFGQILAEKLQ